jgi:REP element-mobilizing transposase RayT
MGREKRVQIEGAIYHAISKGVSGKNIFLDSGGRNYFLKVLGDVSVEFDVDIYSYVLMSNHYHLLFKTNKGNISQFMHKLNTSYSHYFNYRYMQNGHLFHDRFKVFLIKDDGYFIAALRYIALNPVIAQMVKNPESYEWSSFRYLFNKEIPFWLKLNEALISTGLKRGDFISLVNDGKYDPLELKDFEWDRGGSFEELGGLVKNIEIELGSLKISDNKVLRDCLIFYLKERKFRIIEIANIFNVSKSGVKLITRKVSLEVEKGNLIYTKVLSRLEDVFSHCPFVPGTKGQ